MGAHQLLRICLLRKKLLFIVAVFFLMILFKLLPSHEKHRDADILALEFANIDESSGTLQTSWLAVNKCPACFGLDMCRDFVAGGTIRSEASAFKDIFVAKWNGLQCMFHMIPNAELEQYDSAMCQWIQGSPSCNISQAVAKESSPVVMETSFLPDKFWDVQAFISVKSSKIAPLR
jgi:hypothetical protein